MGLADVILAMADYLPWQICVFFASDTALPLTYSPTASDTCSVVNDPIRIAFYEPSHFRAVVKKICCKSSVSPAIMDAIHLNYKSPRCARLISSMREIDIYDPDITCISETWICDITLSDFYWYRNFVAFFDTRVSLWGSGTLFLIHPALEPRSATQLNLSASSDAFNISAAIIGPTKSLMCISAEYRAP